MKFIALGSNLSSPLGEPLDHLHIAVKKLSQAGFKILARAPIYQSAPVPVSAQPDFLNSVIQVEYDGPAEAALAACHAVEVQMGRVRGEKNEARIIDIDILTWGDLVQSGPPKLPHPRLQERAFVVMPLAMIAPDWVHPVRQQTAKELARGLRPTDTRQIAEQL